MGKFIVLAIYIVFALNVVNTSDDVYAQGNLEVVLKAKSAKFDGDHPQLLNAPNLWCQARSRDTNELMTIKEAHFMHFEDGKRFPALISNQTVAILQLGDVLLFAAGKYKCEITTTDGQYAWGWLFMHMRPVFYVNHSKMLETNENDHFRVKAPIQRATEGERVVLYCPVYGYPKPDVEWYKDEMPVASTEQITKIDSNLQIDKVDSDNDGIYSCLAKNSFALIVDGEEQEWSSRLDRELKIRGTYRWVYPLVLILIMLMLLFVIVYTCSVFNRYRTYNVEKRERRKKRQVSSAYSENSSQKRPILSNDKNEPE